MAGVKKIGIAIHGGAGTILKSKMTGEKELLYKNALKDALEAGWNLLSKGGKSVDAVELTVKILEDNPLFNAGKGSVFTSEGRHEMDASIMDGKTLEAGCVSMVSNVRNPVLLARQIMNKSEHVYLSGQGAELFAKKMHLKLEEDEYFFSEFRHSQLLEAIEGNKTQLDHSDKPAERKFGTVGAVACDINSDISAATSTGGMTNKKFGRVGDSAIIGAGTYANNKTCAVSCTGHGEYFMRAVSAYDLSALMEYKNLNLENAALSVIERLSSIGGEGGLIAIDREANIVMPFNSEGMYRASINYKSEMRIAIYRDESFM